MNETATRSPREPHRTVLVVIEEPTIRELVSANLRHAGFFPVLAASSSEGWRLAGEVRPDMVVVDMDSPATADKSFATALRGVDPAHPVPSLMVTSDLDSRCGPLGQMCGATLCVGKPFSPWDLVGRIANQFRPTPAKARQRIVRKIRVGALQLDAERRTTTVESEGRRLELDLAPIEFKVLRHMLEHPERTHPREAIRDAVWGGESQVSVRTVDQYVKRLRVALDAVGAGAMVKTVRGFGYRIDALPLSASAAALAS